MGEFKYRLDFINKLCFVFLGVLMILFCRRMFFFGECKLKFLGLKFIFIFKKFRKNVRSSCLVGNVGFDFYYEMWCMEMYCLDIF